MSKNTVHLKAQFHMVFETDLSEEEFFEEFCEETITDEIIHSEISVVSPDGEVHKSVLADCVKIKFVDFFEKENEPPKKAMAR